MTKTFKAALLGAALSLSAFTLAHAAPAPLTTDTPIETIVANPDGKAVLDKDAPGLTSHPQYEMFKGMSLKELAPMSQGKLTDEGVAKIAADLAKVTPK